VKLAQDKIPDWVLAEVVECSDCSNFADGTVAVCGWHENLTAAARIVEVTGGTLVRQDEPLHTRLRRFADRAAQCWEGADADHAIAAMLEAADMLEGDR